MTPHPDTARPLSPAELAIVASGGAIPTMPRPDRWDDERVPNGVAFRRGIKRVQETPVPACVTRQQKRLAEAAA